MDLIVLDAGVVIAILDANDVHHETARRTLSTVLGRAELVLPASAYAEVLVAPYRRSADAAASVDALIDALPAKVEPATRAISATAAELRAKHGHRLRLPDVLVAATAIELGADLVITTDGRRPALPVRVDVLQPAKDR